MAKGDYEAAKKAALWYREALPGGFYLEIQDHRDGRPNPGPDQARLFAAEAAVIEGTLRLAKETGLPLVATNDAHYVRREDADAHDVLLCIQTGKMLAAPDRLRFPTAEFYLKSTEEMAALFAYCPGGARATRSGWPRNATSRSRPTRSSSRLSRAGRARRPTSTWPRLCRENWARIAAPAREDEYRSRVWTTNSRSSARWVLPATS